MKKLDFLNALETKLQPLPDRERSQALEYYFEIIDDRMDCGMTEEEAVAACGDIDKIAEQIILDTPMTKLVKQKNKSRRRMQPWEIVLLIVGSPVWFCLGMAAFCVLLALSAVLWVVVGCLFVVAAVFGACAFGLSIGAIISIVSGNFLPGLFMLGCGMICAGLAILFFLLGKLAGKGVTKLHKLTFRGIKRCFIGKEKKA